MARSYYNTRRVVESIVPVYIITSVVEHGVNPKTEQEKEDRDYILKLLANSIDDLLPEKITEKEKVELTRRITYVSGYLIIKPYVEAERLAAKLGLVIFYFLKNMVNQGAYNIVEGSNFEEALNMFLEGMSEWANKKAFDKSSIKEARKLHKNLQSHGYYKDVAWVLDEKGE